jgi:hypothetical protein
MATSKKSRSKNGTRASNPQAEVALLARKQSNKYKLLILSLNYDCNSSLFGALWKYK